MSTLYVRLPARAAAENAEHWTMLPCPFALASASGQIEREGVEPLATLSSLGSAARQTVLIAAASDVSVFRLQVPPMSPARLRAALPNLVEDRLITDPEDCVLVVADSGMRVPRAGLRTVAVMQRAWLELLLRSWTASSTHRLHVVPAQFCLPWEEGVVSAALSQHGADIDLAVRLGEHEGLGIPVLADSGESVVEDVLTTLQALAPQAQINLRVADAAIDALRQAAASRGMDERISIQPDDWRYWIAGTKAGTKAGTTAGTTTSAMQLDLMRGLAKGSEPVINWRAWRVPLMLAAVLLAVNVLALNIDWWRMRSDADALRATMAEIFRTAFPKEPVVLDPMAQMQQKLAAAKRGGGEWAPDDFLTLAAGFADAMSSVQRRLAPDSPTATSQTPIAALDYKDRTLLVRFKPQQQLPVQQMRDALAARQLSLTPAPAQGGAQVWQIGRTK